MLNETIINGMNNPDCAFFVGSFLGTMTSFKYLIVVLVFYFIYKFLDALVIEPIIAKIKDRFKKFKGDKDGK